MQSFPDLGLGQNLLKAIENLGFTTPTPIQSQAIPILLSGNRDFIGLAQTGTGKTAAFGLPILALNDFSSRETQSLILAPTRELCVQISNDLQKFSTFTPHAKVVAIYGGANISTQIRQVKNGAQIIVATPGRLIDMISRKAVRLENVRFVILDEADEMLNMGFQDDIDDILSHTPASKNVWLFSATMPPEVKRISSRYMHNPYELTIGKQNEAADNLDHRYMIVHEKDRYQALKRILDVTPEIFGVVFCRTKMDTQNIAEHLMKDGYNADALHGDLSQQQRDKVMNRYRNRTLQVLVATDVAARGIDVRDITHVIHYHLPDEAENYTHRSGRTARAGKSGISLAIINTREKDKIRQIEKKINRSFKRVMVPDAVAIGEQQLIHFIKTIHDVKVNEKGIENFLAQAMHELKDLDKEELIKRMVSIEFKRFLEDYRQAPDLNAELKHPGHPETDRYKNQVPRMFINLGYIDGFEKGAMLSYVLKMTGMVKSDIGRIDIKPVYSFLEIEDKKQMENALKSFDGEFYNGRPVRVELSGGEEKHRKTKGKRKEGNFKSSSGKRHEGSRYEKQKKGWGENPRTSGKKKKKW